MSKLVLKNSMKTLPMDHTGSRVALAHFERLIAPARLIWDGMLYTISLIFLFVFLYIYLTLHLPTGMSEVKIAPEPMGRTRVRTKVRLFQPLRLRHQTRTRSSHKRRTGETNTPVNLPSAFATMDDNTLASLR